MAKKDKADSKKRNGGGDSDGALSSVLVQVARSARTRLTQNLAEHGLYAGQESVIMALAERDGQSPGTIADALGVRAPTITKTINRLALQGFVEKRGSEDDGRKAEIYLTEQGWTTVAAIHKAVRRTEKHLLDALSGKEARTLTKLLKRVDQHLQGNGQSVD